MTTAADVEAAMKAGDHAALISALVRTARAAQAALAMSSFDQRKAALHAAATLIRDNEAEILERNGSDVARARANGISAAFIDRLTLTPARIEGMAAGLDQITRLEDPIGRELARWSRPNGLDIARVATPLGVIGVIYESRPNVTVDAGGLCLIAGNAAILRGGSDSRETSGYLAELIGAGLEAAGLPRGGVQMVPTDDRGAVGAMLAASGEIDVIIPRGGRSLVERVQTEARVPVFAHLEGICHLYIDSDADAGKAVELAVNAKMRRTGICGAAETILVDRKVADSILPAVGAALSEAGCAIRGDSASCELIAGATPADEEDWRTEYLDSIISVRVVEGFDEAAAHISTYGSNHTDCIITENKDSAERFLREVDSAIVMVNASTQFADGGEFGMGAEIGIATGRMHARGPVGAAQLTSFKYLVRGNGQVRDG
ncbi:MAG: glutamate-5-semialdehyde dehydrogenase [Pseudomonadota bacterium]|nr:glutamate-5-semialdehyde dehydrogenase [Pseudomonadota bacterium]MEC7587951.1 glutamate-5-semialdehyde dehydrogenase [Pseudomonadota bacterium]MEC8262516.1 glutamate-5-semialdehyde dehydrogenase [Pseudomonadota bacterium]